MNLIAKSLLANSPPVDHSRPDFGRRAQIWSPTYSRAFDALPSSVRDMVQRKVDGMGTRLETFPHQRLSGRPEFKLRVGDYRVLYDFDLTQGRIFLHYVGNRREIYKKL